jgi:uncharacterized membrane protein YecN with MAPEG domain
VPSLSIPPSGRAFAVMAWISVVLLLDAGGSLGLQRVLGLATWVLLVAALHGESLAVRVQTAVVVVFASAVEYTFAPLLEAYSYRFDNVPAYVPPGHGLVYLAALWLGRTRFVQRHLTGCAVTVVVVGGAYALYGVTLADRVDVLGLFWFCCLVGFLLWGPSRPLYVGAFVVVTYLELLGTGLGNWEWAERSPFDLVPMGNPPSGAAGGYGWFDLAALLLTPPLLRWWSGRRVTPQEVLDSR